jgi:hypothetical protein
MQRLRTIAVLLTLLTVMLSAAAAAPAGAAPTPSASLRIAFTMPSGPTSVWARSAGNCLLLTSGWSKDSTPRYVGETSRPGGLLDVGGRKGEAIVPGEAIHVDRIFGPQPRALAASDVGVELAGRRAYLTGTIRPSRSLSARRPARRRLAELHAPALVTRAVRGRLVVTVRGRATMLKPLTGMFEQLRCRGPRIDEHPIPVGAPLGTVEATIVPARASAAVTSLGFAVALGGGDYRTPPRVEPTGGAQGDADGLRFATAAGARLTTTCSPSGCEPTDGEVALVGGFDLVDGAQRVSLTDLTLRLTDGRRTLLATVGRARVTVANEPSDNGLLTLTDAFAAQLAAAFGDPQLRGDLPLVRLPLGDLQPV